MKSFPSDVSTIVTLYSAVISRRKRRGVPLQHHLVVAASHYTPSLATAVSSWMRQPVWVLVGSEEVMVKKQVSLV